MTTDAGDRPTLKILLNQLDWNLQWLEQMEKNEPTDYYRDASLQRFEFTFKAAIKCIQQGASIIRQPCQSPGNCFKFAAEQGWIPKDSSWENMVRDMEQIKSGADKKQAAVVFENLKTYRESLKALYGRLTEMDQNS